MEKIAIQGIRGSFHHQVATEYFHPEVPIDPCLTFDALAKSLYTKNSTRAVMAIENSIAGSIIPNYALIDRYGFRISGEHYLNIRQNLMALPGQSLQDVKEVHSHPMALLQCMEFLSSHRHLKLVEDNDTAETARRISEGGLTGIAAIASDQAARMYNLSILAPAIQTVSNNMTRFVVLENEISTNVQNVNKASLRFELDHKRGSLAHLLGIMADGHLNLTKIQSLPVIETPWRYAFFADVTFEDYGNFRQTLNLMETDARNLKVLGEYINRQP